FQAEDGIRDRNVTGVQTCDLPIYARHTVPPQLVEDFHDGGVRSGRRGEPGDEGLGQTRPWVLAEQAGQSEGEQRAPAVPEGGTGEAEHVWVQLPLPGARQPGALAG